MQILMSQMAQMQKFLISIFINKSLNYILMCAFCLFDKSCFVITYIGHITNVNSCICDNIYCTAFLVTVVSVLTVSYQLSQNQRYLYLYIILL